MKVKCSHQKMVPIAELRQKFHPKNRNEHPPEQIERLAKILEFQGIRRPVQLSNLSGKVVVGHGMILAAEYNGWTELPVDYQDYSDAEQEYAHVQADNAIAAWADLNLSEIRIDLRGLDEAFDWELLGIDGFVNGGYEKLDEGEKGKMSETFGVPPFTVLDARQGYWQERKKGWIDRGIESGEGRGRNLIKYSGASSLGEKDTSIFDPVLCELAYRWFSGSESVVFDPFAGGSVRGIVAGLLHRNYIGIDLRPEQVAANKKQAKKICKENTPQWIEGNSQNIPKLCKGVKADLILSCPPYFDLEKYSDDPKDLSNMPWPKFLELYRDIIKKSCSLLKEDRFAVWVVGEVRDKKGIYRNFVGETIKAFQDAGLGFYNEAVLVTSVGALPLRAGRTMQATRKLGKTHQNVLVFIKGNPEKAAQAAGKIEFTEDQDGLS